MNLALHRFRYRYPGLLINLCVQTVILGKQIRRSSNKSPLFISLTRTEVGNETTRQLQKAHGLLNLNVHSIGKAGGAALPMARRVELWNCSRRYRN
jgi:hypothetical protein